MSDFPESGTKALRATPIELGYQQPQAQVTFTSPLDGRRKYTDPSMTKGVEISDVIMREKGRESELNMLRISVFDVSPISRFPSMSWYGIEWRSCAKHDLR